MPEHTYRLLVALCDIVEALAVLAVFVALVLLVLSGSRVTVRTKGGDQ